MRISELLRIKAEVVDTFGSKKKANKWLSTYHQEFKTKPINLFHTPEDLEKLMKVLDAIRYGGKS